MMFWWLPRARGAVTCGRAVPVGGQSVWVDGIVIVVEAMVGVIILWAGAVECLPGVGVPFVVGGVVLHAVSKSIKQALSRQSN